MRIYIHPTNGVRIDVDPGEVVDVWQQADGSIHIANDPPDDDDGDDEEDCPGPCVGDLRFTKGGLN